MDRQLNPACRHLEDPTSLNDGIEEGRECVISELEQLNAGWCGQSYATSYLHQAILAFTNPMVSSSFFSCVRKRGKRRAVYSASACLSNGLQARILQRIPTCLVLNTCLSMLDYASLSCFSWAAATYDMISTISFSVQRVLQLAR